MKEIICTDSLDELLCSRIDDQSLGLYDWTNNKNYVHHREIRNKITENTKNKISTMEKDSLSNSSFATGNISKMARATLRVTDTRGGDDKDKDKDKTVKLMEEINENLRFDEGEIQKLDEKYMNEITDKFNYNNFEMSEKVLFINEEAKNLISNILEDTVYNIISEAVYGETNLTESTKIYFFKNKK